METTVFDIPRKQQYVRNGISKYRQTTSVTFVFEPRTVESEYRRLISRRQSRRSSLRLQRSSTVQRGGGVVTRVL